MYYSVLRRLFAARWHRHPEITKLLINDAYYRHVQSLATDTWVVAHNLGKYPAVQVVDSSGQMVIGDVIHDSVNQLTITFSAIFSGEAYCN